MNKKTQRDIHSSGWGLEHVPGEATASIMAKRRLPDVAEHTISLSHRGRRELTDPARLARNSSGMALGLADRDGVFSRPRRRFCQS